MPKTLNVDLGPFKNLKPIAHDSVEDYDKEAGESGACLADADASTWYRSTTYDAQDLIIPILESTGVARPVDTNATEKAKARAKDPSKVADVPMKFVPYANLVKSQVDEETWADVVSRVSTAVAGLRIDASPATRAKGPNKDALNKADDIIGDNEESREARIARLLGAVDGFDLDREEDGTPKRESLARLVQEFVKQSI